KKGIVPGLAVILVGDDPASQVYVRNKERAALTVGFKSETVRLSEFICQEELIAVIERYNADNTIHGILVQLPLPNHINDKKIILAIDPKKDVDGFHPMNTGHLWSGRPLMVPCTPSGIMELLREYNVNLEGKHAVIIGRSNIVGKPMAQLLLDKNATVTLTHSRTRQLEEVCRCADVLIVAIGQGHFITKQYIKEGAIVIDVGMNRDDNGKLIGDVAFDEVAEVAAKITPVPGGVGPMTIAMLLEQTYQSALRSTHK
ncbi:TPA: bifunctional methylenetetrahydrofolate dehydrogenase/methenyltetrahydrofolate cyclohydrolase, partial [Streptococcus pyogenes]